MNPSHSQPGRRFAAGSNRADQALGVFGFVSHALLFICIGALLSIYLRDDSGIVEMGRQRLLIGVTGVLAILLLAARGLQVGASTTMESLRAIRDAWWRSES